MITWTFKIFWFTCVVFVSHTENVLVTDIVLANTSRKHLIFISIHIGSRLFELFSKEVRVKKQPGMPLKSIRNSHTCQLLRVLWGKGRGVG